MSDSSCYYYDSDHNRCLCYDNQSLDNLLAENAELVRVLHELEQESVHAYKCLQHDCEQALESEQHFFKKWWSSDCENAKLRKLCEDMVDYGEGAGNGMAEFFADRMRELGIEVK